MGPLVAIVLAAGRGRRMGQTKQLLPWGDSTVVAATLRQALASQADQVILVTGHEATAVAAAATGLDITILHNPDYEAGEMVSSLQVAVRMLPAGTRAILVLLADQPFIPPTILDALSHAYDAGAGSIIAPVYEGRRGNPVLIGAEHFAELLALPAGSAPRQLLQAHPGAVHLLPVDNEAILQDLDQPEQYEKLYALYHQGK
ncbi:MAG: nucleotidyltransferase family protein [Anaerolineales bacterium]|nr:nucleotidyltransferase family protein [Anaerolineales bacterium]